MLIGENRGERWASKYPFWASGEIRNNDLSILNALMMAGGAKHSE